MASVTRRPGSPYWYACYAGPRGERLKKSTKQGDRRTAMAMAVRWEDTASQARAGALTEAQARKVISDIVERSTGTPLAFHTAKDWFQSWVDSKGQSKAPATAARYRQVGRDFIAHLGSRATLNLAHLSIQDVQAYRDTEVASGKSSGTVNVNLKIVGAAFNAARRQGFIPTNPAEALEALPQRSEAGKDTFSVDQLAMLIAAADQEWRGVILMAYYTGARLTDVTGMSWQAVDLAGKLLRFTPRKTGRELLVPLHPELENYLANLPVPHNGKDPIFPTLAKRGSGGAHGLSFRFKAIMARAGVSRGVARQAQGKKGRITSALSFHSLRHSFNSAMANAGIVQEVRQKLTGHTSAETNKLYTHHKLATLRAAVGVLPTVATTVPRLPKNRGKDLKARRSTSKTERWPGGPREV